MNDGRMILSKINARVTEMAKWHDAELDLAVDALMTADRTLEDLGDVECLNCGIGLSFSGKQWVDEAGRDDSDICIGNYGGDHEPKPPLGHLDVG